MPKMPDTLPCVNITVQPALHLNAPRIYLNKYSHAMAAQHHYRSTTPADTAFKPGSRLSLFEVAVQVAAFVWAPGSPAC